MTKPTILVTGGAGYIGSHMLAMLHDAGYHPVTLDSLVHGHRDAVLFGDFYHGDISDTALLDSIFSRHAISAVMHFAAYIEVAESMREPEKYNENNVRKTAVLLEALIRHRVKYLIFSSTAAVFGDPVYTPIDEAHACAPVNVYGETKWQVEQMLSALKQEHNLHYGVLRYFNAAGADPDGRLGERHEPETHLIPLILQAALGKRSHISIFGSDYPTPDGTCVRDFIHVTDLCRAHLLLLEYLKRGGGECAFNLGTGHGYSVREVIGTSRRVTGKPIIVKEEGRRQGDPAILVADGAKARKILGWKPELSDLETIINHAWRWYLR